jgi:hypothetical protein
MPLKISPKTAIEQPHNLNRSGATPMTPKALISAIVLTISLSISQALAKPNMSPEQLAKARETASQMKPPVNFDALLDEADRLGVNCEGDLTRKGIIRACENKIKISQSDERIRASKERQAKLDEEYRAKRKELAKIIDETKQIANEK